MKISKSIGTVAVSAFEQAIEDGYITGISLDGYTLTCDYTGLSDDDALDRATTNYRAARDAAADPKASDEQRATYGYVSGFLSVALSELAAEHAIKADAALKAKEATMPELNAAAGDMSPPETVDVDKTPASTRKHTKVASEASE